MPTAAVKRNFAEREAIDLPASILRRVNARRAGGPDIWCISPTMHFRLIGAFAAAECHRTVGYGAVPSGKIESETQKCYCQLIESSKFLRKCQTSRSRGLAIPFKPALGS